MDLFSVPVRKFGYLTRFLPNSPQESSTMVGSIHNGSVEELDCGSFFDQIGDLLDFPLNGEDIETGLPGKLDSFPTIWSTESDSVFSNANSDLSAQLSVPVSASKRQISANCTYHVHSNA